MLAYKRFNQKEDERLSRLVKFYGTGKWKEVAKQMNGRTPRQCMDRYIRFLAPDLAKRDWSKEEDALLLELVPKLSPKWRFIASHFDGRSDIQIKNRYHKLLNRLKNTSHSQEKTETEEIKTVSPPAVIDTDFDDMFSIFECDNNNYFEYDTPFDDDFFN